jgi:Ser/Thr protein kinase RdoA (MazF antagonist)
VPGQPLELGPAAAPRLGELTGRIHAALAASDVVPVADRDRTAYMEYLLTPQVFPPEVAWLEPVTRVLAHRLMELDAELTFGPSLWEGPEVLVDEDGTPGLVDWGLVEWRPLVFHVANQLRSIDADDPSSPAAEAFLAAYRRHASVAEAELRHVPLFSLAALAIYAKFEARCLRDADPEEAQSLHTRIESARPALASLLA